MTMPPQKPGRSKQDYQTPDDFMVAIRRRFGLIVHDLAADNQNTQATSFYDEATNALNPTVGDIVSNWTIVAQSALCQYKPVG